MSKQSPSEASGPRETGAALRFPSWFTLGLSRFSAGEALGAAAVLTTPLPKPDTVIDHLPEAMEGMHWGQSAKMQRVWRKGGPYDRSPNKENSQVLPGLGEVRLPGVKIPWEWVSSVPRAQRAVAKVQEILNISLVANDVLQYPFFGAPMTPPSPTAIKTRKKLVEAIKKLRPGEQHLLPQSEPPTAALYLGAVQVGYLSDKATPSSSDWQGPRLDDMSGSLGRFGLRVYATGRATRKDEKTGLLTLDDFWIRVRDGFHFQDDHTIWSQPLGFWSKSGLGVRGGVLLRNASFRAYKDRHPELACEPFHIYTEMQRLQGVKHQGKTVSVKLDE